MATSNVNTVLPLSSCSVNIERRVWGVSINEVHEKVDQINEKINEEIYEEINMEINEELGNLSALSEERCINKVPETLRCCNPKAYTPKILSIGPIHHGNKEFKRMEEIKKRFLKSFLKRGINNKCLKDYVEIIMKREKKLRSAYLEPIEFKSREFVKIIMLDVAFIIEILLRAFFPDLTPPPIDDDLHFYPERMLSEVRSDLLLLENQIPFFILQDLFDNATEIVITGKKLTIAYLFYIFIEMISCFQIDDHGFLLRNQPGWIRQVKHCLDFMRILYKPSVSLDKPTSIDRVQTPTITKPNQAVLCWYKKRMDDWVQTPTITELHQAGVKFIKAAISDFAINFDFNSGVLELPSLKIDSDFEESIRNLVAFEQCQHFEESYIWEYAMLMDDLINTLEDVHLLVKYEIIVHALGDNSKVCALFNNISEGIYWQPQRFYFAKTKKDMIKYCKNPINRWKTNLKQNYFSTPWSTASVIAAILLLILTFIQAMTSVMSLI